jgi:hypothetical protein
MLPSRLLESIVDFLRTGSPKGIVERGYVPLLALCRRRLSDDEVSSIASELMFTGARPIDETVVRVAITKFG